MNVFFLDPDPVVAAKSLCDQHQKMVLESAQLLSTAHHVYGSRHANKLYKSTHINHPSSVWVRESSSNYRWVYDHMLALSEDQRRRGGRETQHLAVIKMGSLLRDPPKTQPDVGLTITKIAARPEFQILEPKSIRDVVLAYRYYYATAKNFMRYSNTLPPRWLLESRALLGSLPLKTKIVNSSMSKTRIEFQPLPLKTLTRPLLKGLRLQAEITRNDLFLTLLDG